MSPLDKYLRTVEENSRPLSVLFPDELKTVLAEMGNFHKRIDAINGQLPTIADSLRGQALRLELQLSRRIKAEQRRLQQRLTSVGTPISVWPVYDAIKAIRELLSDSPDFLQTQWERVELLHSQELAIALARILKPYIETTLDDLKTVELTEIGSKTGDLLTRLAGELQQECGKDVQANGYDLEPRRPLFERHFGLADVSPENLVHVEGADLLELRDSNIRPPDILLLSNILHKLPPELHTRTLQEVHQFVGPDGIVVLNNPHYSHRDGTAHLKTLYQAGDHSEHPEAIRPNEGWETIARRAGFQILGRHFIGPETGFLDDFQHSVLILQS
ncbi:hypothetical protein KKG71_06005 [Patescibacteria group bacterium]|nr:hypothetical protein [Patescibacteria group bacterium]